MAIIVTLANNTNSIIKITDHTSIAFHDLRAILTHLGHRVIASSIIAHKASLALGLQAHLAHIRVLFARLAALVITAIEPGHALIANCTGHPTCREGLTFGGAVAIESCSARRLGGKTVLSGSGKICTLVESSIAVKADAALVVDARITVLGSLFA